MNSNAFYVAIIKASTKEHGPDFEEIRFHGLNYLLNRGGVVEAQMSSGFGEDERRRPECYAEESAILTTNGGIYTYHVDPAEKKRDRRLAVTISTTSSEITREIAQTVVHGTSVVPKYLTLGN
ncbi:MAG: hypothetical protein Q8Q31_05820 [Nanoarchaeota archaeon]|nr:hypothetical protein [Nanoarchaeota archaeon]